MLNTRLSEPLVMPLHTAFQLVGIHNAINVSPAACFLSVSVCVCVLAAVVGCMTVGAGVVGEVMCAPGELVGDSKVLVKVTAAA